MSSKQAIVIPTKSLKRKRSVKFDDPTNHSKKSKLTTREDKLYRQPKGEVKVYTKDSTAQLNYDNSSAVANSMSLINDIAKGTGSDQRIGRKIVIKAIHIRFFITGGTNTRIEPCTSLLYRAIKHNQATTLPPWLDVMRTQDALDFTNINTAHRYKILKRDSGKVIGSITPTGTQTDGTSYTTDSGHYIEWYLKYPKGLECEWTTASTTGAIGDFEIGPIIFGTLGSSAYAVATTPAIPTGYLGSRVYFIDN